MRDRKRVNNPIYNDNLLLNPNGARIAYITNNGGGSAVGLRKYIERFDADDAGSTALQYTQDVTKGGRYRVQVRHYLNTKDVAYSIRNADTDGRVGVYDWQFGLNYLTLWLHATTTAQLSNIIVTVIG